MKKYILLLLNLVIALVISSNVYSQGVTTQGKDFWVSFGQNYRGISQVNLQVRIVATKSTTVTFTFTESGSSYSVNIPAGSVYTRDLTTAEVANVYPTGAGTSNKTLRIQSTELVSVYVINITSASTDATNVLPVTNLGTNYYQISYRTITGYHDGYLVVATENNTSVYENGVFKATLQAGGVYASYVANIDLTGKNVTSDKPVAFFVTNIIANVPTSATAGDCLFQQIVPVNSWGNHFLVPVTKRGIERVRVLASQNGTTVTQTGGTISSGSLSLDKGEFVELEINLAQGGCFISSDKPVGVCSYLLGTSYALNYKLGDPSMAWVPPIEQSVNAAAIAPFVPTGSTNLAEHYALIVTEADTKDETRVSIGTGEPTQLTGGTWTVNNYYYEGRNYAFYSIQLTDLDNSYFFTNPNGLTAMGYGLGNAESYYYLSGAASRNLDVAFYVDGTHYQDLDGEVICYYSPINFEAVIQYAMSNTPGYLKWYINGVEEVSSRDQLTWSKTLSPGTYTISLSVLDLYNETNTVETTFTISEEYIANDDYVEWFSNRSIVLDVLSNDVYSDFSSVILSIIDGPKRGTAVLLNDNSIEYTSEGDYAGLDSLTYSVRYSGNCEVIAKAYIKVYSKPGNIVDDEPCVDEMGEISFGIREQSRMVGGGHPKSIPLVGDLDGDGVPEIVVLSSVANYNYFHSIKVYDGGTRALKATIPITINHASWMTPASMALVDADGDGMGEILITSPEKKLYSYRADTTGGVFSLINKWPSGVTYTTPSVCSGCLPQPLVADFNGDGVPEVVIFNQIFNASTGALMGTTEAIGSAYMGRNPGYSSNLGCTFLSATDVDGDGYPEIIAGAAIYKVNISSDGTTATCTTLSKNTTVGDGFTAVADLDLDGNIEVVVAKTNGTHSYIYVWRPNLSGGAGTYKSYTITSNSNGSSNTHSFPFIGDIDGAEDQVTGKKYPEICLTTVCAVTALKYNPTTDTHSQLWKFSTTDASGGTGITLFDFDNDGASELVYRDQNNLRIIDGKTGGNKAIRPCASGTAWEYPIIADTDGDGSANICVTCYNLTGSTSYDLVIFESNTEPWTPTLGVWNQVNYDPLLINNDLTVPKIPIPKTREFNGKVPYNGALLQVPIVDWEFNPILVSPDPAADSIWTELLNGSTVRIWLRIKNYGARLTNSSLPVALYGVNPPPASADGSHIQVQPIGVSIAPGDSLDIYFDVPLSELTSSISVRIQDDGVKYPADGSYLDCDDTNNSIGIDGVDLCSGSRILYVNKLKDGKGVSWDDALKEFADALYLVNFCSDVEEIWVAEGVYSPKYNNGIEKDPAAGLNGVLSEFDNTFILPKNVKIYGGFPSNSNLSTTFSERNYSLNETILSGKFTKNSNDAYYFHVVISIGEVGTTILDGFSIINGVAEGTNSTIYNGKHIHRGLGGGVYINSSSPVLSNLKIYSNKSFQGGGGICNYNNASPLIKNCLIWGNESGINLSNHTNSNGGTGGGIYNHESNPSLVNVTIAGNKSYYDVGGMSNADNSCVKILNSIIWGNTVVESRPAGFNYDYDMQDCYNNCIPGISYSLIGGYTSIANNNLSGDIDPMFNLSVPGDYTLLSCSPAINVGNNNGIISQDMDLSNQSRIYQGTVNIVDLGAFEFQGDKKIPDVNSVSDRTVCLGDDIEDILLNSTMSGTVFEWNGGNDAGLLDGTGTEKIPAFKAMSYSAIVNITPKYYNGSSVCLGDTKSFEVIIKSPGPGEISQNEYLWTGAELNNDSWNIPENWLLYNGNFYETVNSAPAIVTNVRIMNYGACVFDPVIISDENSVCNNLTITGTNFILNDSKLKVYGNWINNGMFTPNNNTTVTFTGNPQTLRTIKSNGSSFTNIKFDFNGDIELLDILKVTVKGEFNNGIIHGEAMFMQNSTSIIPEGSTSFINGTVTKYGTGLFVFPLGNINVRTFHQSHPDVEYTVVGRLGITPITSSTSPEVKVKYIYDNQGLPSWWHTSNNLGADLHHVSDREYWKVESNVDIDNICLYWQNNDNCITTSLSDVCVHGFCNQENLGQIDLNSLSIAVSDGGIWNSLPTTRSGNHVNGYLYSYDRLSFGGSKSNGSLFVSFGALDESIPLPVELLEFNAKALEKSISLDWITLSEINNDHFEIERSLDAVNFKKIGEIGGNGFSSRILRYFYEDTDVIPGVMYYYRLKQVDFDLSYKYSNIRNVIIEKSGSEFSIYPNPAENYITLIFEKNEFSYEILNNLGMIISSGINNKNIDISHLAPGAYMIKVASGNDVYYEKFIKE